MVVGYHHFRKPPFGDIPKNGEHEYEYDMCISCVCILYMSYGRNYLFGENMGKCHHQMWRVPYRFCGFGIWIMENRFRGPPIDYEGSLHRFKVQGNFFLLCSSTNFVGYSYVYHDINHAGEWLYYVLNIYISTWNTAMQSLCGPIMSYPPISKPGHVYLHQSITSIAIRLRPS